MQIQNSVFLIAGGGSGLGAATAKMLIENGASVVLADINKEAGIAKQTELGPKASFVETNVTDEASVQAAVDLCVSTFSGIHGAVNCAGVAFAVSTLQQFFSTKSTMAWNVWGITHDIPLSVIHDHPPR